MRTGALRTAPNRSVRPRKRTPGLSASKTMASLWWPTCRSGSNGTSSARRNLSSSSDPAGARNPADYVKVKFEVSERAYDAWPPMLKELFTPARTVETGKASYELVHIDGRRA